MARSFSFSEASTALDCWARHAFSYTGHLTDGDTLRAKDVAPILSGGRAWGAAVAALHQHFDQVDSLSLGLDAMRASLGKDAERQLEFGFFDQAAHDTLYERLAGMLGHYAATTDPMIGLSRLEEQLEVPIPSRTGVGVSNLYRYLCQIDGWWVDEHGHDWLVEFKLRGRLTPVWLIQLSRQVRWYSWAWARQRGRDPVGVIVEERLNELPKEPRVVNARRKADGIDGMVPSHDKDQLCLPGPYQALCRQYGVEEKPETVEALRARKWQQREPIMFRPSELEEAGLEMVSVAKLIRDLDSGELYPMRNAKQQHCNGCRYREICPAPDRGLVDRMFERTVPKRLRTSEKEAQT